MKRACLRAALAMSLLCSASASQAADFIFTFSTDLSDPLVTNGVSGTVTGRIIGLADDGTSSAVDVFIDSYSPDGSLVLPVDATSWFSPVSFDNSFTVEEGVIVAALFRADTSFISPFLDQLFINVPIHGSGTNYASLGSNNSTSIWNNQGLGGITFTRIENVVPEPSTWMLLLLGFGFAGLSLRSRRDRLTIAKPA